jgi:diguanylate cyclase (GGDEF)-like protein
MVVVKAVHTEIRRPALEKDPMQRPQEEERTRHLILAIVTAIVAYASLTQQFASILVPGWVLGGFTGIPEIPVPLLCTTAITVTVSYVLFRYIADLRNAGELAFVDDLTGLANRRQFDMRLENEIARGARHSMDCAVLYLDIDRFKHINDSYGHEAGDEVIKQFASRIARNLRSEDFVARLAGDEFAAVITHVHSEMEVDAVAQRMFRAMSTPVKFRDKQIYVGMSIGAAIIEHGEIAGAEALRRADFALFQAKEGGRNKVQIFTKDMEDRIRSRAALENDMRDAIANDRFQLAYQPLICPSDRRVLGVEALVRWIHPERGPISSASLVEMAEDIGMIEQLGTLVLRRACAETLEMRGMKLAVNISPVQFMQPGFVGSVRDVLLSTGFEAQRLELEIAEQVFRTDPDRTRDIIGRLRGLGVRIAIDDFGTGFSSMMNLRDFPLDRIKIDRSFIRGIEESAHALKLVSHMIELGSSLGLSVTVEGVETPHQFELLRMKGLTELQGYLFSRPMTVEELQVYELSTSLGGGPLTSEAQRSALLRLAS